MTVRVLAIILVLAALSSAKKAQDTQHIQVVAAESTSSGAGIAAPTQVSVHILLEDGSHVALWCSNWIRHCYRPLPGTYEATVNLHDEEVWINISGHGWTGKGEPDGKTRRVKYQISGNW
jgi:hypothetical protein